jgi:uncharacterized protein
MADHTAQSQLPHNVMHFVRILRRAGLAIGPGRVVEALKGLALVNLAHRDDVYWALHAMLVDRHAHSEVFRLAFDRFWRAPDDAQSNSSLLDDAPPTQPEQQPSALPRRVADAFAGIEAASPIVEQQTEAPTVQDVVASWSAAEKLRGQDFETMTAEEMHSAKRLMATLRLPIPDVRTRRFKSSASGSRVDLRATLRASMRTGDILELKRKTTVVRHPPLVVLCDISGSMGAYARMLLHFLHAITNDRDRVHVFLFGTRLTNVTRELAHRDPDVALSRVGRTVQDWSGGTRIGEALTQFNRQWSRRVLGQGAVTLLITDGLDRDGGVGLATEMQRLHRSSRRLIWLNPLLRYAAFEAKSAGIKAMLPYVDEFRPVHNLNSLAELVDALSTISSARRDLPSLAA